MIEVTAKVAQGAYLAGEIIECSVTFSCPSPSPHVQGQGSEEEEILALASAQIYCRCRMNNSQAAQLYGTNKTPISNKGTSFAPLMFNEEGTSQTNDKNSNPTNNSCNNRVVSTTKPTILFCDLRLLPGESRTFWYRERLPMEGPPSFRGQIVRYAYKLTIGTQKIHSQIKLLHLPIKVLVLQEFSDSGLINGSEELKPANPFLSEEERETHSDSALQLLQTVTSQRKQKFYNVTNSKAHVAKFCAFKQAYKLGEDIVGSLDFSESSVPCIQYGVSLQSTEELSPEYREGSSTKNSSVSTYSKYHEMTIGFTQTHFVLPIPLHITPSFYTDSVSLKWKLHFEFVISTQGAQELELRPTEGPDPEGMDGKYWQAPSSIKIETMVWDLPIKLYPNLPSYLSQGLQTVTEQKIRI